MNPVHTFPTCFPNIHSHIIFPYTQGFPCGLFPSCFPTKVSERPCKASLMTPNLQAVTEIRDLPETKTGVITTQLQHSAFLALRNTIFHHRDHKCQQLDPTASQYNTVYIFMNCLPEIHSVFHGVSSNDVCQQKFCIFFVLFSPRGYKQQGI
jgi:hypothetical protein